MLFLLTFPVLYLTRYRVNIIISNKSNTNTKHIDNSIDFTLSGKSVIMMIAYKTASIKKAVMIMEVMEMTEKEQIQKNVEEFSRLQDYMVDSDKESAAYKKMKKRYIELKVILATFGVNLTELDYIKE